MTDIQIAQAAKPLPIAEIAKKLGLSDDQWEPYGSTKAKITAPPGEAKGKLVLVTAISPTPAGEGKTTVSVGLADAFSLMGKSVCLCLREPSLGPVFGIKGGAAGGGYAQVIPMEELNLHFTGDIHAVTAANNLLAAAIDNHLQQGNALGIDCRRITWRRCMDMNDRCLRDIAVGMGGTAGGVPRQDGFDITAASEVMAILCLAENPDDLKRRLARIVVGYTAKGAIVTCGDLKAQGAMAALLRDAVRPNLVQTLEHTPTLIHGGPFANIAHGCNSLIATRTALGLAGVVVTEAGFGADLGAEKFLDIKCRMGGLSPSAAVIVATARALRHHGGLENLAGHIENITKKFGIPAVVAINRFSDDTDEELNAIKALCVGLNTPCELFEAWEKGGEGGLALAGAVSAFLDGAPPAICHPYELDQPLKDKITAVATKIYGADGVKFSASAEKALAALEKNGFGELPVCIAKTQYSFSDDPAKLGRPSGFTLGVSAVRVSAGAGFVVCLTGSIMTMPGLPKAPAYEQIDIDADGVISGLF